MQIYVIENSGSAHDAGILSIVDVVNNLGLKHTILLGSRNYKNFESMNNVQLNYQRISIFNLLKLRMFSKSEYFILYNTTSTRNVLFNLICSIVFWGKNIYYIRNANSWIKYSKNKKSIIYSIIRFLVYVAKKIMLRTRKFVCVEKETIQKFLINKGFEDVVVVPYIFCSKKDSIKKSYKSEIITLTCPGIIDLSRKNLFIIYKSIMQLIKLGYQLKLVFLGRPKTEQDRVFCENIKKEFSENFSYFNNYIDENEYNKYSESSDLIIGSYYIRHQCEYFDEIYGTTKGSGVDAHAITHSKVLVVNSEYEVDEAYRTSTLKFNDEEELVSLISKFIDDREWRNILEHQAEKNSQKYLVSNFIEQFRKACLK